MNCCNHIEVYLEKFFSYCDKLTSTVDLSVFEYHIRSLFSIFVSERHPIYYFRNIIFTFAYEITWVMFAQAYV